VVDKLMDENGIITDTATLQALDAQIGEFMEF
jgi:hypothetical protein